jgi:hypothetical protein
MNFSMTGQDKVDLLIQVTAWTCLTMIVFTLFRVDLETFLTVWYFLYLLLFL